MWQSNLTANKIYSHLLWVKLVNNHLTYNFWIFERIFYGFKAGENTKVVWEILNFSLSYTFEFLKEYHIYLSNCIPIYILF